ncbi:glycosyltransferase family 4 protein [Ruminococcus flavefaciens]|uniref:glycosyltransferase family 4 protein n=1 Tax=Ruminococcus flavefaciens TaxID=1265 RepID=UPI0026EFAD8B|nr:glycosyltransferase family 4 protein [Ruminococcus flavefaciens]
MSETMKSKKRVLFLVNHEVVIYNFRLEIVERLLADGHEVHISSPYGERIDELTALGAKYHEIVISRHGLNPVSELNLLRDYKKLLKEVKPDIVLGFTIKPNIYGAMAADSLGIPFVANITGLGTAVENAGWKQKVFINLYKVAFKNIQCVFFQNTENRQLFVDNRIAMGKHKMLPGSGVNLDRFPVREYPSDENGVVRFAFISRIMKEKGIDYYLAAAKAIRKKYPNAEFHVCGFCEAEYEGKLTEYNENGTVIYHGMIHDVAEFLENIHCVIHPTYYPEGLSNVLLEASASGRPIITTNRSGCREVIDDGVNGYMIPCRNGKKLIEAVDKFMRLSNDERKAMGLNGRAKVEKEFDRQIVVQKYVDEVEKA